jgi:hypothetical protein
VAANVYAAPVTLDQAPSPTTAELRPELVRNSAPIGAPLLEASDASAQAFNARALRPTNPSSVRADAGRPQDKSAQAPAEMALAGEGGDLDPDLKEAAKAARQWVEESVPWARQKSKGGDDRPEPRPRQGDATDRERAVPGMYPNVAGDTRGPRVSAGTAEFNLLDELLKLAEDVIGHPLMWLAVALIVIGSAGMSIAKRLSRPSRSSRLSR